MLGAFLMIEAALPAFGAIGGSIIDIGSTASAVAAPQLSIYTRQSAPSMA
jgi:3-oxoacyl-[acyl-carrier protein] reductase